MTQHEEEHQRVLDMVAGLPKDKALEVAHMMGVLATAERHEDARLARQKLIDDGCRIKVSCTPRERKWRVMAWTGYQTRKDDSNISRFKGWQGTGPFEGKGDTETEATENLLTVLEAEDAKSKTAHS